MLVHHKVNWSVPFSTLPTFIDWSLKILRGSTNQEDKNSVSFSASPVLTMVQTAIEQTVDDGDNTDFGPTLKETSADGGEANSDGDKRDVKQRW